MLEGQELPGKNIVETSGRSETEWIEFDVSAHVTAGPGAMTAFEVFRDALKDEYQQRVAERAKGSPQESSLGFLKRVSYAIIARYIEDDRVVLFEQAIRREGRGLPSTVKLRDNPFYYGLLALFSSEHDLSRQDRSYFAQQMLYAYRHRVPSRFLVGFLYQVGSNITLRRKLGNNHVEPGFLGVYDTDIWSGSPRRTRESLTA